MDKSSYSASIIINTYNRAPNLRQLLGSLTQLEGGAFEVVVVNGPSTDNTHEVLKQYAGKIKVGVCPTRNLSQSRNIGISIASGDIVVFVDDDALPIDKKWLFRFIEAFSNDSFENLAAVGGPVLHRDSDWREFDGGMTTDYAFQKFGNSYDLVDNPKRQNWFPRIAGGNAAFLRKALIACGGFDEFYKYYLEETDVCIRLVKAGYRIQFLPNNGIRHYKAVQRTKPEKIQWDVIACSDTYFSLKNAVDPLAIRLAKIIWNAPRKHFFKEINQFHAAGEISRSVKMQLLSKWFSGFTEGLAAGLKNSRSLYKFDQTQEPFLSFPTVNIEKALRIALLSQTIPGQPNYGGIGRFTYDLALGLHERGHEVHIVCKDEQPIRREMLGFTIHGISAAEQASVELFKDRPVLSKNLRYSVAVARRLEQLYKQGLEFDVVHAPNWDAESAALIRMQVYPVVLEVVTSLAKVINTEHLEVNEDIQSSLEIDRWQIASADIVTVPSRGICASYEALMGIPRDETSYWRPVPLGIVPFEEEANDQHQNARLRLLFVGRLERRKGIHTLLEVLPELMAEFHNWECHLVGNDAILLEDGSTFKDRFLENNSGADWLSRVFFHGKVSEDELHMHYRQCDLFVAPSLQESFGLIYHEAMQYEKAVVGCYAGGVPEVVEHGVEGLLVAPDNPGELRKALMCLMRDHALRSAMGKAGAERIHKRNNYRMMAAGMEELYYSVVAEVADERKIRREQLWKKMRTTN